MGLAAPSRQYFLGIQGQQLGPFSHEEVIGKISAGTVPPDSLVWYEGLSEWTPIVSIEFFKDAWPKAEVPGGGVPGNLGQTSGVTPGKLRSVLAGESKEDAAQEKTENTSAIRSPRRSRNAVAFEDTASHRIFAFPAIFTRKNIVILGSVGFLGGIFFLWQQGTFSGGDSSPKDVISKESGSIFIKSRAGAKPLAPASREERLRKVLSQLLIKPDQFLPELEKLGRENPTDAIGKQAFEALFDYYKGKQRYHEAANALIPLQRYSEAMLFYLKDPPKYLEAAQSALLAYTLEKDRNKKKENAFSESYTRTSFIIAMAL